MSSRRGGVCLWGSVQFLRRKYKSMEHVGGEPLKEKSAERTI